MQILPPGFDLAGVIDHLGEYASSFLATGAVGFRYWVLRGKVRGERGGTPDVLLASRMARHAATIGLIGALIGVPRFWSAATRAAARADVSVWTAMFSGRMLVSTVLIAMLLVGFALAAARLPLGWPLAGLSVAYAIVAPITALVAGEYGEMANPIHVLAGGLWIGTLFVLVIAGIGLLFIDPSLRVERGPVTTVMVNTFSPLALVCGGVIILTGVTNAVLEVGSFPALWVTPYGRSLLVKLAFVVMVFVLGAWNWRRVRPRLGSEDTAAAIRRSATRELLAAAAVLIATAVMHSFPAPTSQARPAPPGPATGGAPVASSR